MASATFPQLPLLRDDGVEDRHHNRSDAVDGAVGHALPAGADIRATEADARATATLTIGGAATCT